MSTVEAQGLIREGKIWFGNVWIRQDYGERDTMIQRLNGTFELANLPIRISRGWQHYDPVVRVNGKPHTYAALILEMTSSDDGGVGGALTWTTYRDRFPPALKYDEDVKKEWS